MLGQLADIDAQLEQLLALDPAERGQRLAALEAAEPAQAAVLARFLAIYDSARTDDLIAHMAEPAGAGEAPQIPGYRILAELGHGGMASVYAAERSVQGVVQLVALKLLRRGADAQQSKARFLREQRILAALRHPHIASLIDVGEYRGRPWIAMEYIDGVPIDQHFTPGADAVEPILRTFLPLLDAVQSAHEQLIVHRDIKPDNVLVDREGSARLLDFGIAKPLLGGGGREDATRTGAVPMTLRYASPEQLRGEPVGVASDVYQLGLLLFRVVTGAWPFAEGEDRLPIARLDLDAPLRRPSLAAVGRRLSRRLRGDLDAILLKCLRPRPAERYRSVRELQLDIERHLASQPVIARRPTWRYVALRFVRRNRAAVSLAVAATVVLVAITAGAVRDARRAEAYAAQTQRVLDVAIEILNESDPYLAIAAPGTLDSASLRRIAAGVLDGDAGDPDFVARIVALIASVQERRGDIEGASALLRHMLAEPALDGAGPALRAELVLALARSQSAGGDNTAALALLEQHAPLLERHQPIASQVLHARIDHQAGRVEASLARLEVLAEGIGATSPLASEQRALLNQLAIARGAAGDRAGSIRAAERAIAGFEPGSGRETSAWMTYSMNLAIAYGEARRYAEADRLHAEVAAWARRVLGAEHPQLAIVERSRAAGLMRVARFAEARALLESVDDIGRRHPLPIHRDVHLRTIAAARMYAGEPLGALDSALDAVVHARATLREFPGAVDRATELLAWLLTDYGAYGDALRVLDTIAAERPPAVRVAALVRLVASGHGFGAPAPGDAELLAARPCLAAEAAMLSARIAGHDPSGLPALPAECDGHSAARVHALGGAWSPPWAADFPLVGFSSPLVERLRNADRAPVPLPAALAARIGESLDVAAVAGR
jgi:eukaryotic-like serine/threonine-protein kinase